MKKIKILSLLALALPLLAGCGEEEINPCAEAIDHAPMLLNYSSGVQMEAIESVRDANDFDAFLALTELNYLGVDYDITWEALPANSWRMIPQTGESSNYTKYSPIYGNTPFDCSLKATVSNGTSSASLTWKFRAAIHETEDLSEYTYMSIHDMNENFFNNKNSVTNGNKYYTYGKITATVERSSQHIYSGFWIQDGADALYCYQVYDAVFFAIEPQIGDTVIVGGTLNDYGGLMEMYVYNKPSSKVGFFDIPSVGDEKAAAVADPVKVNIDNIPWENEGEISKKVSCLVEMSDLVYVSGKDKLAVGKAGTLKCKHGEDEIDVTVNYHIGTAAYTALINLVNTFVENQTTFKFYGVLSEYSDALNLNPVFGVNSFIVNS